MTNGDIPYLRLVPPSDFLLIFLIHCKPNLTKTNTGNFRSYFSSYPKYPKPASKLGSPYPKLLGGLMVP